MPKVYKVVKENANGTLSSCRIWGKYELTYKPGKTTVPKIGRILCFRRAADAKDFAYSNDQIWRCFAPSTKKVSRLAAYRNDVGKFWSTLGSDTMVAPTGTVSASSVTLISKVVSKNGN